MYDRILAFCDPEEEYTWRLSTFLNSDNNFPWNILCFTDISDFLDYMKKHPETDCLISEAVLEYMENQTKQEGIILLNESGYLQRNEFPNINKYQAADRVKKELLRLYAEKEQDFYPRLGVNKKTKLIAMFSPVGREMQTSFAICYGRCMAQKKKTLYLNFDYYCGYKELLAEENGRDLMSLLYYMKSEKDKFGARLQSICNNFDGLEYIAPMTMGQNLAYVTLEEWRELFLKIEELGTYDYIILDLSEGIQGLFEILNQCFCIYTMTQNGRIAQGKMERYEQLLHLNELNSVLEKSRKLGLETIHHIPENMEEWSKTGLYTMAREWVLKDRDEEQTGKDMAWEE